MKKLLCVLLGCSALAVLGHAEEELFEENSNSNVSEESFLVQKEMEVWRTDKEADSKMYIDSCQAVRIHPRWFLTAAHCVYPSCNGSLPCTVQITMASAELRQTVRIKHSTTAKNVFIYH